MAEAAAAWWEDRLAELRLRAGWIGAWRAHERRHVAVVGHLAKKELAGAERSLIDILRAIDRSRFRVSCILPTGDARHRSHVERHADRVHSLPFSWWNGSAEVQEEGVREFERLFADEAVDLVHVNTITLRDPLVAARRLGLASIVHVREIVDQDDALAARFSAAPPALVEMIKEAADFVVANSDATHRLFRKRGHSFRLYNCVDTDRFDIENAPAGARLRVGLISSNIPKKGIAHFADAAIAAAARGLALDFVAFGPRNAHVDEQERRASAAGMPVNLRFAGYADDPLDAVAQVNVVASLSTVPESFGRTLIEGMAARRPVVAFDGGAVREIVRQGVDGFVVPRHDVDAALACLELLNRDRERLSKMGAAGRRRVCKLFGRDRFATRLNRIYHHVLNSRGILTD
jgi:glycosyltransferase involved in cell wall biosynthesis